MLSLCYKHCMSKTVAVCIAEGSALLASISDSPRLDTELILMQVTGLHRVELITKSARELTPDEQKRFADLLARRSKHEPVAYLTGKREFWGLDFIVTPDVLIPRPETELIVENAIYVLGERTTKARILDLGTGSGALAVALMHECQHRHIPAECVAVDKSPKALAVAARNAAAHGVDTLITFRESDWWSSISDSERFDLIVTNPPYVEEALVDANPTLGFEPRGALASGVDGLRDIQQILRAARRYLVPQGTLLCEIGSTQKQPLREWIARELPEAVPEVQFLPDLAGLDRILELVLGDRAVTR